MPNPSELERAEQEQQQELCQRHRTITETYRLWLIGLIAGGVSSSGEESFADLDDAADFCVTFADKIIARSHQAE